MTKRTGSVEHAAVARNFVGGKWVDPSGTRLPVFNPATGHQIAEVGVSTAADLVAAVDVAQAAFLPWRNTPPVERARPLFRFKHLMEAHFEELAQLVTLDHGKTLEDARGEVRRAIENVEVACGIPTLMMGYGLEDGAARGIDEHAIRQPLGVFAAVVPFNFPLMVPFWFWPYAVACGNTYIIKPSEQDPLPLVRIFELLDQCGFPPGVINLVQGTRDAVDAILDEPRIQGVSFVGSSPVARYIYSRASANGKRVQAQGGAKNTLVVLPDAVPMVNGAVTNILGSCFGAAGQRCLAGSILLTVGDVHSAVMDTLVTATRALTVGDGADPSVDVGPVVSAASRDRIMGNIDAGTASGATLLVDGRKPHLKAANTEGFFVGPTLFDHVAPENALAQTEIFGPVLSVDNVPNLDAAIDRINAGTFGNAASLYTGSGKAAREFRHRVVAGNIGINVGVAAAMAFFPFAGMKASFFGTLHGQGRDAVEFFTDKKIYIERWF